MAAKSRCATSRGWTREQIYELSEVVRAMNPFLEGRAGG